MDKTEKVMAEWSEEDERMFTRIEEAIKSYYAPFSKDAEEMLNWFNPIKDRVQPQPKQEWSEEDEIFYSETIAIIESWVKGRENDGFRYKDAEIGKQSIDWLKSFRPQSHWKPSDEQMELIKDIVFKDRQKITRKELAIFHSIYNDLKRLKE